MAKVTYIDFAGKEYVVDVDSGANLMQAALDGGVPGILGDCGGGCACATCHVFVDPDWSEKAGKASELEADMLDGLLDPQPTSRLSCQIIMSDALDGVVIRLPKSQL
jgi:2Fe-2S ferredoxin